MDRTGTRIRDLLLFWSSKENKLTSLKEYVDRMPESQEKIYYVCADSVETRLQDASGRAGAESGL